MNNDMISRKALIEAYDKAHQGAPGGARKLMEEAPGIDAVEVVRCKHCKQCRGWKNAIGIKGYKCYLLCVDIEPDDFCSHGERLVEEEQ